MKKVFVEKVQEEEGPIELVYERMMQAKRDGKETTLYSITLLILSLVRPTPEMQTARRSLS